MQDIEGTFLTIKVWDLVYMMISLDIEGIKKTLIHMYIIRTRTFLTEDIYTISYVLDHLL